MPNFPQIASGSIVRVTEPGSRQTDGEPVEIPAIVMGQYPEDGTLSLFCFHFEGAHLARVPVVLRRPVQAQGEDGLMHTVMEETPNVVVVFDAGSAGVSQFDELREIVANDIQTLQRQMTEFQEQVLGMLTSPPAAPPVDAIEEPVGVDSTRKSRRA